jgi:hypothetical protein
MWKIKHGGKRKKLKIKSEKINLRQKKILLGQKGNE